jgi:hypothetical protein
LSFLMKWCTDDIVAVTRRNGSISHDQYAKYIHFLKQNIPLLSCPFCAGRAWLLMFKTLIRLLPYRDRAMVRRSQAQAQR